MRPTLKLNRETLMCLDGEGLRLFAGAGALGGEVGVGLPFTETCPTMVAACPPSYNAAGSCTCTTIQTSISGSVRTRTGNRLD